MEDMKERLTIGFNSSQVQALKAIAEELGMDVYTLIRSTVLATYKEEIAVYLNNH